MSKYVSLDKFIVAPTPTPIPVPLQHLRTDISPPVTNIDALLPSIIKAK
ncbi:Uncharacterised protein [Orientia tsutsugamushi]|uniref:Uncharacterized protein n=1 Tax=Orientia tsutsugamushi TaxID=784 RepID=A0A2R8F5B4_ORITS|nr:Uncharacterised protein [Orientia tsutsugamushi]